jgi:hypothetical protein
MKIGLDFELVRERPRVRVLFNRLVALGFSYS